MDFKAIDTPDKAYWLGFILTRGIVWDRKHSLHLNLRSTHLEHLETLRSILGVEDEEIIRGKNICSFNLYDQDLLWDLSWWGVGACKGQVKAFDFKQVPDHLFRHLLRGVLESSAYLYRTTTAIMTVNNAYGAMLNYLIDTALRLYGIRMQIHQSRSSRNGGHSMRLVGRLNLLRLRAVVYDEPGFFFPARKRQWEEVVADTMVRAGYGVLPERDMETLQQMLARFSRKKIARMAGVSEVVVTRILRGNKQYVEEMTARHVSTLCGTFRAFKAFEEATRESFRA